MSAEKSGTCGLGRASGNSCRPAAVPALENPGAPAAPPTVEIAHRTCQLTLDRRAPLAGALQGAQRSPCRTVISMSDGAAAAAFRQQLELQTEVASLRSGRARERRLRCARLSPGRAPAQGDAVARAARMQSCRAEVGRAGAGRTARGRAEVTGYRAVRERGSHAWHVARVACRRVRRTCTLGSFGVYDESV